MEEQVIITLETYSRMKEKIVKYEKVIKEIRRK
jgi:hypothetical protein